MSLIGWYRQMCNDILKVTWCDCRLSTSCCHWLRMPPSSSSTPTRGPACCSPPTPWVVIHRCVSARKMELQCVSNGVTSFLHQTIDIESETKWLLFWRWIFKCCSVKLLYFDSELNVDPIIWYIYSYFSFSRACPLLLGKTWRVSLNSGGILLKLICRTIYQNPGLSQYDVSKWLRTAWGHEPWLPRVAALPQMTLSWCLKVT